MDNSITKSVSKKQLCDILGCSYNTLRAWLQKIPNLDYETIRHSKLIPPKEANIILKHLT